MPTQLGDPYSVLWRGKYPAMLKEDYPVWEKFLTQNINLFVHLYYNVRLGGVIPEDPTIPDKDKQMYYNNTAKRIDVLAELDDEIWIIEVAATPGLRALGQLTTYVALWYEDPKINKPARGVLVCQSVDEDLKRSIERYGMYVRYAI